MFVDEREIDDIGIYIITGNFHNGWKSYGMGSEEDSPVHR